MSTGKDTNIVSIIIPLYNRVGLIKQALASIISQTYPYWEAVVVDDGSTDGSYALVQELAAQDRRIKPFERARGPKGASTCRNIGIENASGKYIIFLDSDDLLAPFCLAQRVSTMEENPEIGFAVFNMMLFSEKPDDTRIVWNIDTQEDDLMRFLRIDGVWSITGPIYRKAYLQTLGGFDESAPFWQDFEMHIRVLVHDIPYRKFLHQKPDCYNRRHDLDSISQKGLHSEDKLIRKVAMYQEIIALVERHDKLNNASRKAIVSFLLYISRQFVLYHHNLQQANTTWSYAHRQHLVNDVAYMIGKWHLRCLYQAEKQRKSMSVAFVLSKCFSLMLKKYRLKKSTSGKIKLEHATS